MLVEAELPDDPALLRAMLVAAEARIGERNQRIADLEGAGTDARVEIERLNAIIAAFRRHRFRARSEQLHPDQLALALEELDAAVARMRAGADASAKPTVPRARDSNRGRLPAHLERVEQVLDVQSKACACCGGALHVIAASRPVATEALVRIASSTRSSRRYAARPPTSAGPHGKIVALRLSPACAGSRKPGSRAPAGKASWPTQSATR